MRFYASFKGNNGKWYIYNFIKAQPQMRLIVFGLEYKTKKLADEMACLLSGFTLDQMNLYRKAFNAYKRQEA